MTARKYFKGFGGFTLVELLIVIALLAIIALIVIAAINPIEQANRARDTGLKSDASQMVSAMDRYFASRYEYPWVSQVTGSTNDDAFGFVTAADYRVGICAENPAATTDCAQDGLLITTNELKTEFRNRNFIDAYIDSAGSVMEQDYIMMGKVQNSDSVYACYVPLANSNRQRACDEGLTYTLDVATGARTAYTCPADMSTVVWSTPGNVALSVFVCVPE